MCIHVHSTVRSLHYAVSVAGQIIHASMHAKVLLDLASKRYHILSVTSLLLLLLLKQIIIVYVLKLYLFIYLFVYLFIYFERTNEQANKQTNKQARTHAHILKVFPLKLCMLICLYSIT